MPIVNNSKFYVLGVNQNTKQVYIVSSWDEDARKVQLFPMKEKVGDKMLEEIITYPDIPKKSQGNGFYIFCYLGSGWNFFPAEIHTVKSLQAVVLNYEGRISEQMHVISRLEMKHGD